MSDDAKDFARWKAEIDYALKDEKYRNWIDRSEKIVKRYRDERRNTTAEYGRRKYNILWANVQTLAPAVYGKMPKPIAERRFLDRDPAARLASTILERTLAFQMECGGFHGATNRAVMDYLLPGMGVLWLRYEPEFESRKVQAENDAEERDEASDTAEEEADEGFGETEEKLSFERVCFDYVYYKDFLWSPGRIWCEVPWVARRSWVDQSEAEEQFGEDVAKQMTYGDPKNKDQSGLQSNEPVQLGKSKKAEVWEIWCKPERKVYFIATETPGVILKQEDDPLGLEGFFPSPEPLFTTQTNDTIVPVPDYVEYQDQAAELDELTDRIAQITTAIRANGVYDASQPALQRLLQAGMDNKLIPVDSWAAFAEKGGMQGAVALLPMEEIIKVLIELYNARDRVKQDLYEITGMSDILRGATDPQETASAQKIKANYATGRLGSRQETVAEFCANGIRIAAEMIAEIFSDDSLRQMSGIDQMDRQAIQEAVEAVQPPPKPDAQQQQGQPPVSPQQQQAQMQAWQATWDEAKRKAAIAKQTELNQQFQDALKILRSDKLRGFRVDIETDSTIADDMQADKAAAVELITGVMKMLEGAEAIGQSAPEMVKPLGGMLMWAYRKYRVGRTLEASLEDALDQIDKRLEEQKNQPQQPTPEMVTAQAQMQVAQAKQQESAVSAQAELARAKSDIQIAQIKLASEQQQTGLQTQLDAAKLQIDQLKAAIDSDTIMQKARLESLTQVLVARLNNKADTDSAMIDAQLEALLGLAKMHHEQTMQANDHQQEASMAAVDQQNQLEGDGSQAPAPKSKPAAIGIFTTRQEQQHNEAMQAVSSVQARQDALANQQNQQQQQMQALTQALTQMAQGLHALAMAQAAPKRVIYQNGKPVGVETVQPAMRN